MNNGEIKSINMGHIKCDIQDAVTYLKQERNRNGLRRDDEGQVAQKEKGFGNPEPFSFL